MERIKYLKLKNVKLIKGDIAKTLPKFFAKGKIKISSCNIDTDLYDTSKIILPYISIYFLPKIYRDIFFWVHQRDND